MKNTITALILLSLAVFLLAGYQYSIAQPTIAAAAAANSKIGVVSVRKVFRDCKLNANYRAKALSDQSKIQQAEEKMNNDIEAQEAGLKALKPGSDDHLTQVQDLFEKKANFEAMRQFNTQRRALKDQTWTEMLYQELLVIVKDLARKNGLNLVLEVDEPEFPTTSSDELMMSLQTHKVLFSEGCVDLTSEVTAELDKREAKLKF